MTPSATPGLVPSSFKCILVITNDGIGGRPLCWRTLPLLPLKIMPLLSNNTIDPLRLAGILGCLDLLSTMR